VLGVFLAEFADEADPAGNPRDLEADLVAACALGRAAFQELARWTALRGGGVAARNAGTESSSR